jgi:hypothetical protein
VLTLFFMDENRRIFCPGDWSGLPDDSRSGRSVRLIWVCGKLKKYGAPVETGKE